MAQYLVRAVRKTEQHFAFVIDADDLVEAQEIADKESEGYDLKTRPVAASEKTILDVRPIEPFDPDAKRRKRKEAP